MMNNSRRSSYFVEGVIAVLLALLGLIWTVNVVSRLSSREDMLASFGVLFICVAVVIAVYCFKKAAEAGRCENEYDNEIIKNISLTDGKAGNYGKKETHEEKEKFCPHCGTPASGYFDTCLNCGKKL
jgi:hypothetical protein